jgi:hypothetical protein
VPPKRRFGARDLLGELVPTALDGLAKVEVGERGTGAELTRIGDIAKDACEGVQAVPRLLKRIGRRVQLAQAHVR